MIVFPCVSEELLSAYTFRDKPFPLNRWERNLIMKKSAKRRMYEQRIYRVQDYICGRLDLDLSLEQLARVSAFSPFHFHRIFRSVAGETLYDFIRRKRLEKACAMLAADNDMRIIDIALSCGFSTPSSFSKAFKQHYNMSPSEWRGSTGEKSSRGKEKSNNGTCESSTGKELPLPVLYKDLDELYNRRKSMNVTIETLPAYHVAYMRQIGPYGPGNYQLMDRLKKWAAARDLLTGSSVILGIAHDDPDVTPAEKCRYDCCIVIQADYNPGNSINVNDLPGGKYAVYKVRHTAEDIGKAWADLFTAWLPDSGFQVDDRPVFERYMPGERDRETGGVSCEICVPVRPL